MTLFQEANTAAQQAGEKRLEAESFYFMGNTHSYSGQQEEALKFILKAKVLFEALDDKNWLGQLHNQLGAIYYREKQFEKTAKELSQAAAYFEAIGNKQALIVPLVNEGLIQIELENWEAGQAIFERSLVLSKELKNNKVEMDALSGLGKVNYHQKAYPIAINYFQESLALAESANLPYYIQNNYQGLSKAYYEYGNYRQAYDFALKYYTLKDSLTGKETQDKISALQVKFDTEQKEKALIQKDKELLQLEQESFFRNVLLIGLLLLLIAGIIAYNQHRLKAQKQQELIEVKLKNAQLEKEKAKLRVNC